MCDYCQWIANVSHEDIEYPDDKNQSSKRRKKITPRKPSPIIIVHGFPNDVIDPDPSILELMKKSGTEGYKMVIQGSGATDVVQSTISLFEERNEYSNGALIKCSALVDDQGKMGYMIGENDGCTISGARKLMESSGHPLIVQENTRRSKEKKECNKNGEGISGCFGVIVRDKNGRISCGRISWEFNEDFPPSIPAAAAIYGCGIFVKGNTCFSMSGDNELIYTRVPARRMFRGMETTDKHFTSKRQIANLMNGFEDKKIGVVFLGNFDRAVVFSRCKSFPWVYCSRNMVNYGGHAGEIHSEDVSFEGESLCTCHWR